MMDLILAWNVDKINSVIGWMHIKHSKSPCLGNIVI